MKLAKMMLVAAVAVIPMRAGAQERAGNAAIWGRCRGSRLRPDRRIGRGRDRLHRRPRDRARLGLEALAAGAQSEACAGVR